MSTNVLQIKVAGKTADFVFDISCNEGWINAKCNQSGCGALATAAKTWSRLIFMIEACIETWEED